MPSHLRRVTTALAATLAGTALLTAGVTPATATYEPGEPEVAWGQQVASPAEEVYGEVEVVGHQLWVTGWQNTSGPLQPVLARYDREGRLLEQTISEEGGAFNRSGSAIDGGTWGAVVTTTLSSTTVMSRYSPEGDLVWSVPLEGDRAGGVEIVVDGDTVFAVGAGGEESKSWRIETFDLSTGAARSSQRIPAVGVVAAVVVVDGLLVLGGYTSTEVVPGEQVGGMYDIVIMALDAEDLSTRWAHQFGTPGADWLSTLTAHGDTLYWGASFGSQSGYPFDPEIGMLGAWNLDGTERWRTRLGPGNAPISDLVVTSEGLVLSGQVYPGQLGAEVAGFGYDDAYLQGRSFTGEELWTQVYGTADWDGFAGLATEGDDRLYVVGYTGGLMFGEAPGSPWDAVLVALDVPHLQKPDLSLRVARRGSFKGDNRYSATGTRVRVGVRRGDERELVLRVEDDGLLGDRQVIRSCSGANRGLRLTIRDGRRDVTRSTSRGTFRTRMLRPGGAHHLRVLVDAAGARPGSYTCSLVSRSGARRYEADRLDLRIVVTRGS